MGTLLSVRNGLPAFSFDLGGGVVDILGNDRIDSGDIHKVKIMRHKTRGYLQVQDGEKIEGVSKVGDFTRMMQYAKKKQ